MISESQVSMLIVASEIGAALALILIIIAFFAMRCRINKKKAARELVSNIKSGEESHRSALVEKIKQVTNLEEEKIDEIIAQIMSCEKSLYNQMVKVYMGYGDEGLGSMNKEVDNLSNSFIGLVEQSASAVSADNGDMDSATLELKQQVARLREEKMVLKEKASQLQADFDAAMESMERMTLEYAQMYEGGSKEGEQRMKNEMYQLKQKLGHKTEGEGEGEGDDVPDMDSGKGQA